MVDRRILWTQLKNHFGMPISLIRLLRSLFDENFSKLHIYGEKSEKIQHLRGLPQGSSIACCSRKEALVCLWINILTRFFSINSTKRPESISIICEYLNCNSSSDRRSLKFQNSVCFFTTISIDQQVRGQWSEQFRL